MTKNFYLTAAILAAALSPPAFANECQRQVCTIIGTDGDDTLEGTEQADVICGLKGNDIIYGRGGDDLICGGKGQDQLFGNGGADVLVGGKGKDQLRGGRGADELYGNQGKDTLDGGRGADYLIGGHGKDTVDGGNGNDICYSKANDLETLNCVDRAAANVANAMSTAPVAHSGGSSGFIANGEHIYAPDGGEFIPRGVNVFPWHGAPNVAAKITYNCWQFNTVRLHAWILPRPSGQWKDHVVYVDEPVIFDPETVEYTTYDVAPLIDYYTSQGTVVIFDVHDKIGRYFEGQDLDDYLTFIADFADKYKNNPYVWLDVHNEPGTYDGVNQDFSQWRAEIPTIMDAVRAIAPDMIAMIPGAAWGQDTGPHWNSNFIDPSESALLANSDIIDDYDNVIATFHMYDQWVYGGLPRLEDYIDQLYATLGIPVLVGEYGSYNNNSTLTAVTNLHDLIQQSDYQQVGRIAWTWDAYDLNNLTNKWSGGGQWVDSCSNPTNLTTFGQLVWDDNH